MESETCSATFVVFQGGYASRSGEKATFYIATPCGGAGVIPQKLVLGKCRIPRKNVRSEKMRLPVPFISTRTSRLSALRINF